VIKPLFFVCHWIAMSNGCYNPFIYAIFSQNFKEEFRKLNRCQGIRRLFQSDQPLDNQVQVELQQNQLRESSEPNSQHTNHTNLTIRKSKELGMESMVVVIQHEEQHQSTAYSCQMQ
jgi:hypothetical protein